MANNLCVIPARGKSSRLKNKNLQPFLGTPLIQWTINIAKESKVFSRIIVSTENEDIKSFALKCGVEVQDRPPELATDESLVADTMEYVLENISEEYDYVQLLQANTPLITSNDVYSAMKFAYKKDADFVISVTPRSEMKAIPMEFACSIPKDRCLTGWMPEFQRYKRTQDIERAYYLDANIYIGRPWIWRERVDYWTTKIYAYEMFNKFSDIHFHSDIVKAEIKWRQNRGKSIFN